MSAATRRQALAGIGLAGAAALVPVVGDSMAKATTEGADRRAWDAALARYEATRAELDRLWQVHADAEEQLPGRVDRYFDELGLHMGMPRERVEAQVRAAIWRRENGNQGLVLYPPAAVEAQRAIQPLVNAEAECLTEEFMSYQEHEERERKRLRIDELAAIAKAYGQAHYFPARDALMGLPAPDEWALIVKLDVALMSLDDEHAESAKADVHRILGRRA